MMKFLLYLLVFLLFIFNDIHISAQDTIVENPDCNRFEKFREHYSAELLKEYYPFVAYDKNCIEWFSYHAMNDFFLKLQNSENRKIRVLHIGDSHIHSDIYTGYVRKRLQMIFGSGGRGLMFPYCTANTHATRDYKTSCTGNWTSAKTTEKVLQYDVGVTGVTARTDDVNATASLIFRPKEYKMNHETVSVQLIYKPGEDAFDPVVKSGNNVWKIQSVNEDLGVIKGEIEWASDTLVLMFSQSDSVQNSFELYGLVVEYKNSPGIIYHSAGLNGAAIQHLIHQNLFENHLAIIKPDLLILDLGTNDIYRGAFDEIVMGKLITTLVLGIKQIVPETEILLMPPQDMYYRRRHVVTTENFSALLRKIAKEQDCGFYDYFAISGGNFSMLQWEKTMLAKKDRLHLTTQGYEFKGKLFVVAFLDAYLKFLEDDVMHKNMSVSGYDTNCVMMWFADTAIYGGPIVEVEMPPVTQSGQSSSSTTHPPAGGSVTHVVRSGENLGVIARKYGVTVAQIQQWNGLVGTTIYPGQKLVIYGKQTSSKTNNTQTNSSQNSGNKQGGTTSSQSSSTAGKTKLIYTVKSGDSLWAIAKNHGVTVENIKKWNNLTSDKINPGQKLEIYK